MSTAAVVTSTSLSSSSVASGGRKLSSDLLTQLSNVLPTGTFLAFQVLAPLATNNGDCSVTEKVHRIVEFEFQHCQHLGCSRLNLHRGRHKVRAGVFGFRERRRLCSCPPPIIVAQTNILQETLDNQTNFHSYLLIISKLN
jgi:hypothetical protein